MADSAFTFPEIPEHTLLRIIGRGAYGEVWLARNALGAYRAVKVIHRESFEHDRPYERELRAIREVEPLTRQHPGLVDILQVGERDGFFYYIMELADDASGALELDPETYRPRTLTIELYERERLPTETTCSLGVTIAKALAFLHENNLVHRDVKLSNIVYVNGQAKLADVGLVTRSDASFSLVGTYGYIPREGPGRPPADIYALGKVLYETATGKDRADFPEIDVMDPALKGLNHVFLKACAEEPDCRFINAEAMADELQKLIDPTESNETGSSTQSTFKTAALAASLLLILAVIFFTQYEELDPGAGNMAKLPSPIGIASEPSEPDFLKEALVLHFPFNGNALDKSGRGNDGEVNGAVLVRDRHGKANRAYGFDGQSSNIQVKRSASIKELENSEKEFSIALWVNLKQLISDASLIRHDCEFSLYATPAGVVAERFFENTNSFRITRANRSTPLNRWTHICCVFGANGEEIFIDGEKQQTVFGKKEFPEPMFNNPLSIGKSLRHHSPAIGALDDIRVYNRVLKESEFKALYEFEKPQPIEWDFTHEYKTVVDPAVDQYLQGKENAKKYVEEDSGACYWAPISGDQPASVTYRYSFKSEVKQAAINATLATYNFGPHGVGHSSIWASKDGENWEQIFDGPHLPVPPGKSAQGADYQVKERLPNTVLGGRELWIQARLKSPDSRFGPIFGQFSRAGLKNTGSIFALKIKLYENKQNVGEQRQPLVVDKDTVLLEHFEGATTGKSNRPVTFDQGRIGQGLRLAPKTSLSWDKGALAEGTFEFWYKLDEEKHFGTLASANFSNLPAAITLLIRSEKEGNIYSELFTGTAGWARPQHEEHKMRVKQWNHVAISWGRKGINTYLNGVRVGYHEGVHLMSPQTGTWVLGAQIRSSGDGFAGVIDEVRISRVQRQFNPADFQP